MDWTVFSNFYSLKKRSSWVKCNKWRTLDLISIHFGGFFWDRTPMSKWKFPLNLTVRRNCFASSVESVANHFLTCSFSLWNLCFRKGNFSQFGCWYYLRNVSRHLHDKNRYSRIATVGSCFALIGARQRCVAKICNASSTANVHKLQNDLFTISRSVLWTHLCPETRAATSRVSGHQETKWQKIMNVDGQGQPKHSNAWPIPCFKTQRIGSKKTYGPKIYKWVTQTTRDRTR